MLHVCIFVFACQSQYLSGKDLIAAVDRKLAVHDGVKVTTIDLETKGQVVNTTWALKGGYAKSDDSDELSLTNLKDSWIVHKKESTFERFKPGELKISPFIWQRWGKTEALTYSPVTTRSDNLVVSIVERGQDTRLELEFNKATLMPTVGRIFVGINPEIRKAHWKFTQVDLDAKLQPSDFLLSAPTAFKDVTDKGGQDLLLKGSDVPPFNFKLLSGQKTTLNQQLEGHKALLLSFWFYKCGACRLEFPSLIRLNREYARKGLKILSVNGVDDKGIIQKYFQAQGAPFEGAVGISDLPALNRYKFGPCPMTVLIDRDNRVAYVHVGFDEATTYSLFVRELAKLGIE